MTKRILCAIASLVIAISSATAETPEETVLITAVGVSTDQYSAAIYRPLWAKGIIITVDVTAVSDISLDLNIQYYSSSLDYWFMWCQNCPSAGGISETGTTTCYVGPGGVTLTGHYEVNDQVVMLPQVFRVLMDASGAGTISYTVRSQWVKP